MDGHEYFADLLQEIDNKKTSKVYQEREKLKKFVRNIGNIRFKGVPPYVRMNARKLLASLEDA